MIYSSSQDFKQFPYSDLKGGKPVLLSSNNYFIKYTLNESPVYIQLPRCKSKQGIINVGKRHYIDFMLTNDQEECVSWIEKLETHSIDYLYENRKDWFEEEMEKHEIETYFVSPIRVFKSGRFYILRVPIASAMGKPVMKIYNEDEVEVKYEDINEDTILLSVIEFKGIRCSPRSFQLEMEVKQMMSLKPEEIFDQCIFKSSVKSSPKIEEPSQQLPEEVVQEIPEEVVQEIHSHVETVESDLEETSVEKQQEENNVDGDIEPIEINLENFDVGTENPEPDAPTEDPLSEKEEIEDNLNSLEKIETEHKTSRTDLDEVLFDETNIDELPAMKIKDQKDIYYEMYHEAKRRAKMAKDMALNAYLEAKKIKQTYGINDDSDSDGSEF
jgi:hypothetical protein